MKKKIIVILSIFTLLFLVSCGSTPEEETKEPEAPVETEIEETPIEEIPAESIEEISQEEVDALLAETKAARDRAIEAGAETKYPEELKKADDYFNSVKDDKASLKNEKAKIIEMYDSLTNRINAEKAKADLLSDIEDARAAAISAGVENYLPEELKKLDDYVATLKEDEAKFDADGAKVPGYYNTLKDLTNDIILKNLDDEIYAARGRAVAAGVDKVIPDELKELDEYVETLKADEKTWKADGPKVPAAYDALIVSMNNFKSEQKLLKEIDTARAKAIKAGAETETPDELKKLDDYYASLKNNTEAWKNEGSKVPGYYDLLTKFVNDEKIAANLLLNIKTSREKAIEAGAETKAADKLKVIDDYTDSIEDNSDSVKAKGHKASNAYKSLVAYIGAIDAKQIIDGEGLAPYAQTYYDRASTKIASVEESYKDIANLPQTIISDATDARRDFRNVITVAYKQIAKDERNLAYEEKKNADKVRAGVTQKERYKAAVANFKKGDSLYSMQDAKNAIEYYKMAKDEFADLYGSVSEEMLAALAAIEAAKKNVAESSQYAEEADELAPITSKNIEGIEDEDTVLLEADNYEDPNASVIAIDEVVEVNEDIVVEEETEELVADEQYVEKETEENEVTEGESADNEETETPETESSTESETTESGNVEVTEETEKVEESSEDIVEAPVITDEVVTDDTAATDEEEVTEDVTIDVEVSEK